MCTLDSNSSAREYTKRTTHFRFGVVFFFFVSLSLTARTATFGHRQAVKLNEIQVTKNLIEHQLCQKIFVCVRMSLILFDALMLLSGSRLPYVMTLKLISFIFIRFGSLAFCSLFFRFTFSIDVNLISFFPLNKRFVYCQHLNGLHLTVKTNSN